MGIESPVHLIFIGIVALLVLGPKRLPEVARALGHGLREFREAMNMDGEQTIEHAPIAAQPPVASAAQEWTAQAPAQGDPLADSFSRVQATQPQAASGPDLADADVLDHAVLDPSAPDHALADSVAPDRTAEDAAAADSAAVNAAAVDPAAVDAVAVDPAAVDAAAVDPERQVPSGDAPDGRSL
jgi:TatA/E family protein of Tat protein translocase